MTPANKATLAGIVRSLQVIIFRWRYLNRPDNSIKYRARLEDVEYQLANLLLMFDVSDETRFEFPETDISGAITKGFDGILDESSSLAAKFKEKQDEAVESFRDDKPPPYAGLLKRATEFHYTESEKEFEELSKVIGKEPRYSDDPEAHAEFINRRKEEIEKIRRTRDKARMDPKFVFEDENDFFEQTDILRGMESQRLYDKATVDFDERIRKGSLSAILQHPLFTISQGRIGSPTYSKDIRRTYDETFAAEDAKGKRSLFDTMTLGIPKSIGRMLAWDPKRIPVGFEEGGRIQRELFPPQNLPYMSQHDYDPSIFEDVGQQYGKRAELKEKIEEKGGVQFAQLNKTVSKLQEITNRLGIKPSEKIQPSPPAEEQPRPEAKSTSEPLFSPMVEHVAGKERESDETTSRFQLVARDVKKTVVSEAEKIIKFLREFFENGPRGGGGAGGSGLGLPLGGLGRGAGGVAARGGLLAGAGAAAMRIAPWIAAPAAFLGGTFNVANASFEDTHRNIEGTTGAERRDRLVEGGISLEQQAVSSLARRGIREHSQAAGQSDESYNSQKQHYERQLAAEVERLKTIGTGRADPNENVQPLEMRDPTVLNPSGPVVGPATPGQIIPRNLERAGSTPITPGRQGAGQPGNQDLEQMMNRMEQQYRDLKNDIQQNRNTPEVNEGELGDPNRYSELPLKYATVVTQRPVLGIGSDDRFGKLARI